MLHTNTQLIDNNQRTFFIKDVWTRDAAGLQVLGYDIENKLTGTIEFMSQREITKYIDKKTLKIVE